ncbi:hypothetical protein M0R45_033977 [Rubus argutus]|uniref:Uncharacterized protein n=1 Tax=Rubus argutus TaxID=59490 RepID=A0AAW1VUC4_RUBAR
MPSSQVSDDTAAAAANRKSKKSKSSSSTGAPIVVHHFPVNSYHSRIYISFNHAMAPFFSAFLSCFLPSFSSQRARASDDGKAPSNSHSKESKKTKPSGAPIVVSHFPTNSYISRL